MRASDADRDRVIETLGNALADGRLTVEEHAERLDAVSAAKTLGELEVITQDLPAPDDQQYRPPHASSDLAGLIDPSGRSDEPDTLVGIFGGGSWKGRWRVRRRTRTICFCGGFDLDMSQAKFDAPTVEIKVFAMFGGVDIKVPAGVEVQDRTVGVFGGFEVKAGDDPQPGAPVIVVKGFALFGGGTVNAVRRR